MNNEKIIEQEMLTLSGQTFSSHAPFEDYCRKMLKRVYQTGHNDGLEQGGKVADSMTENESMEGSIMGKSIAKSIRKEIE